MSLAATVKAMAAAGCSAEQIAAVVEKIDEERRAKSRAGNAERQRRWRERNGNNGVTQRDEALSGVTERYAPLSPQDKETSPTPPKENSTPLNPPESLVQRASPIGRQTFDSEFPTWYQAYPRHEGKAAALKAFNKVRSSGVPLDVLVAAAERYRPVEQRFTKLPATWLNAGCWEDEAPSPTTPVNGTRVKLPDFCFSKG